MAQPSLGEFRIAPRDNITGSQLLVEYADQRNETAAVIANGSIPISHISRPMCQQVLYWDINQSRVRVWDVLILVPNAVFLLFLLGRLRPSISKLRASSSPMFSAFYGLVWVVCIISVLRCIVSMTVDASLETGNIADRMLWLILRFFLLSTEASVITFGFYFGYLDSRTSIQRVLACTSFFALGYSTVQCTLELHYEHEAFSVVHADNSTENFDLFAHGGMIFLCTSSTAFGLVYFIILILPLTTIREKLILPSKPSFYYYVAVLAVLNLVQAVGSILLYQHVDHALCVVDTTVYIYFTLFDPLVYVTFLRKFFRSQRSGSLLFSYSHQEEEATPHDSPLRHPHHPPPPSHRGFDQESSGTFDIATVGHRPWFSASLAAGTSPPSRLPTPFLSVNDDWRHLTD